MELHQLDKDSKCPWKPRLCVSMVVTRAAGAFGRKICWDLLIFPLMGEITVARVFIGTGSSARAQTWQQQCWDLGSMCTYGSSGNGVGSMGVY